MVVTVAARPVIHGAAEGHALVSVQPISFWGGVDPETGVIIDRRHDRCGASIAGRVFIFPEEKGSSTASAVLIELARNGNAPAAIVTEAVAPILALGSILAEELYGVKVPLLTLPRGTIGEEHDGATVSVHEDGTIHLA